MKWKYLIILFIFEAQANFQYSINWDYNQFEDDVLLGIIEYESDCQKTDFIQIAKLTKDNGDDLVWPKYSGQEDRNKVKVDRFFVDVNNLNCQKNKPCSPFYTDHFKESSRKGSSPKMLDAPFGWGQFSKIELETCSVCLDNDKVLSCMNWGGSFSLRGERKVFSVKINKKPSSIFYKALSKFYNFYTEDIKPD